MRTSSLFAVLLLAGLLTGCGGIDHNYNRAQYDLRMKELQKNDPLEAKAMDGFWALKFRGRLLHDPVNPRYDAYIKDPVSPEIYLMIKDGTFARSRLRKVCGPLIGEPEAKWLMDQGFDSQTPAKSRSHDPGSFMDFIYTQADTKSFWHPFELDNRFIKSAKSIRHPDKDLPDYIETRLLTLSDETMEIAYKDTREPAGVHTLVEVFGKVHGDDLYVVLSGAYPVVSKCK